MQNPQGDIQRLATEAQIILEYLKATSYDKSSGLLTDEVLERRERLSDRLEKLLESI